MEINTIIIHNNNTTTTRNEAMLSRQDSTHTDGMARLNLNQGEGNTNQDYPVLPSQASLGGNMPILGQTMRGLHGVSQNNNNNNGEDQSSPVPEVRKVTKGLAGEDSVKNVGQGSESGYVFSTHTNRSQEDRSSFASIHNLAYSAAPSSFVSRMEVDEVDVTSKDYLKIQIADWEDKMHELMKNPTNRLEEIQNCLKTIETYHNILLWKEKREASILNKESAESTSRKEEKSRFNVPADRIPHFNLIKTNFVKKNLHLFKERHASNGLVVFDTIVDFLRAFEAAFSMSNSNIEEHWKTALDQSMHLTKDTTAKSWYRRYFNSNVSFGNWSTVRKTLIKKYQKTKTTTDYQFELLKVTQQIGETLEEYTERFWLLVDKAGFLEEYSVVGLWLHNLHPCIQHYMCQYSYIITF